MLAGVEDFHGAVVDRAVLELAERNIEDHFDAVLLSERFDEGLLLLSKQTGWGTPWYLRRKVGNYSAAAKPDPETRRKGGGAQRLRCRTLRLGTGEVWGEGSG